MELAEHRIDGVGVSPGIAIGTVWISHAEMLQAPDRAIQPTETDAELQRFRDAVETGLRQLRTLRRKAAQLPGDAAEEAGLLLDVYARMLQGSRLVRGIVSPVTCVMRKARCSQRFVR